LEWIWDFGLTRLVSQRIFNNLGVPDMPLNAGVAGHLNWWVLLVNGKGAHTLESQRVIAKCSSKAIAELVAALHQFGAYQECEVVDRDLFRQEETKRLVAEDQA
jgi:hypothetical protein